MPRNGRNLTTYPLFIPADLASCPEEEGPVGQNPCDGCTPAGDCEVAECIADQCIRTFKPNTVQCRVAAGDCDEPAK